MNVYDSARMADALADSDYVTVDDPNAAARHPQHLPYSGEGDGEGVLELGDTCPPGRARPPGQMIAVAVRRPGGGSGDRRPRRGST